MTYLLDTDTLVFYLRGRTDVWDKLLSIPLSELCTSSVCIGELYHGAAKSQKRAQRKAEVDELRGVFLHSMQRQSAMINRVDFFKECLPYFYCSFIGCFFPLLQ